MLTMRSFSSASSLLFFVFAVAVSTTTPTSAQECTLKCPDESPCIFGHADFTGHAVALGETHRNGMHCDCAVGWTGVLCDKKFESCTNQQGHECYHGGQCIPGLEDSYENEQLFCDCSTARSDATKTRYVGKYCETPFEQVCNPDADEADHVFCVNGGECDPEYPDQSSRPCLCEEGWEGFHCEFKAGTVPKCALDCQNGGVCVVGVASPTEAEHMNHVWSLGEAEDHMRCLCPPGVGGALCEAPAASCGPDGLCLNGGTCVATTQAGGSRTQHHCDCAAATDDRGRSYAGKYCEHPATATCSDDDWNLFCTQGGTCKSNPIEGCSCPTGAAGYKCEFILDNLDGDDAQDDGPESGGDAAGGGGGGDDDDDQDDGTPEALLCASGGGEGFCRNGGICVEEEDILEDGTIKIFEFCDCSLAHTDTDIFDGAFCQYKATNLCLIGNESAPPSLADFDRFCVHHGTCQEDGSCSCPPGWEGDHCELPKTKVSEPGGEDGGTLCGDTRCYNGGTCVETEVMQPEGDVQFLAHCDCSTAFDKKFLYAGESCQFPSTQLCTAKRDGASLRGTIFCTNHGTCKDNVMLGCDCPDGFNGFACEFERQGDVENDGKDDDGGDDDWEICGDEGLVCHNGGRCLTTVSNNEATGVLRTEYACDCTTAYDEEKAYLGLACEYPSTTICDPELDGEPLSAALFCVNHGTCKNNPFDGCDCQDGFTGTFCQLTTDIEDIIDGVDDGEGVDFEKCGNDSICLNGGVCVTTLVAGSNGELIEFDNCDCTAAFTETDVYAGKSCEHKATTICAAPNGDDIEGIQFCTNGGKCKSNHLEGCDCSEAWHGFRCEFATEVSDLPDRNYDDGDFDYGCHLQCKNGGICAHGTKDLGYLHDIIGDVQHLNSTFDEESFAHCVCPKGWVGLQCDHKIEVCGEDEHVCLHGSKCIKVNGEHACDCSEADEVVGDIEIPAFAGDSCQHSATDICTIGDDYPGKPLYFCVNSGRCNSQVAGDQPDPGCSCGGDWSGPHCEINVSSSSTDSSSDPTATESDIGPTVGIAIGVVVAILAVLLVGSRVVAQKRNPKHDVSNSGTPFPRRRRRVNGFGGSHNLAPPHGLQIDPSSTSTTDGIMSSNSDPVVAGFAITPDDEPGSFDDEDDIVMHDRMVLDESYSDDPVMVEACPPRDDDVNKLDSVDFV